MPKSTQRYICIAAHSQRPQIRWCGLPREPTISAGYLAAHCCALRPVMRAKLVPNNVSDPACVALHVAADASVRGSAAGIVLGACRRRQALTRGVTRGVDAAAAVRSCGCRIKWRVHTRMAAASRGGCTRACDAALPPLTKRCRMLVIGQADRSRATARLSIRRRRPRRAPSTRRLRRSPIP